MKRDKGKRKERRKDDCERNGKSERKRQREVIEGVRIKYKIK